MTNAKMTLQSFRVTNFRSVNDSGWIDASEVTSLIGTNESGKTNLLVPLWKLNPAKEGEINLLTDAPRKDYNNYRASEKKPIFITARFQLADALAKQLATLTGAPIEKVRLAEVKRDLSGKYYVSFPDASPARHIEKNELAGPISSARHDIATLMPVDDADGLLQTAITAALNNASTELEAKPNNLTHTDVKHFNTMLEAVSLESAPAHSTISARYKQVINLLAEQAQKLGKPGPNDIAEARQLVRDNLPVFVYYSTYGNLDSEIYLPHVIEDLKRTDLSGRSEARARTLRVLFDFVRLQPEEILELGKDHNEQAGRASEEQIKAFADKKKERSVLLQSASTELTKKFREWWKQGEYRIRFEADGNHFRIWVSDDKRPDEIELEGRSTGLQWFLSFYLIFLVESRAAHNGAILVLDEPGLSLHPLAQRDLAAFFDNLSQENQLLYTTHSPFLVDADHLDRVRAVYVDEQGHTAVSTNLRQGQSAAQTRSIYPVHAALGLSVSDTLFQGCRPIIVEGQSDQLYLSTIKLQLISAGLLNPTRELLFVPTSGVKAIKTVASILGGKDEDLPLVLCDGDNAGTTLAKHLKDEMYKAAPDRIMLATDYVGIAEAEIEDLFPKSFISPIVDRYLRGPEDAPFQATDAGGALIPQVKAYAKTHGLTLSEGWKVELARLVKARITPAIVQGSDWNDMRAVWQKLFQNLAGDQTEKVTKADAAPGKKKAA